MSNRSVHIVDGQKMADQWLRDIAVQVRAMGEPLHLSAVLVGDDEGLKKFVELKRKAAAKCGIDFSAYYPDSLKEATETLAWLAGDESIHGIFVELPLPSEFDGAELLSLIPREKDVDLITPAGEKSFYDGSGAIKPPAVSALERVLRELNVEPSELTSAVIGQGKLVGEPVAHWLAERGSLVSVIDIDTESPDRISAQADLVVAGTGVPGLVTGDWVKEDAIVVDYGFGLVKSSDDNHEVGGGGRRRSRVAARKQLYAGDVDADSVKKKAGVLTPVPGGMGPLVIAATLENLITLATS